MSQNVAEFVWKRINAWGLSRVYGYPGDGVGGLDVALEKAKGFMDYVQVRHEEMAAFMASAHAKFTGLTTSMLNCSASRASIAMTPRGSERPGTRRSPATVPSS